jgi:MarR family transcriptional regulator, organic hydroperoxide resistance regulator
MSDNNVSTSGGFLLWRATNAWQRAQRAALEPFDLTHVQFALLSTLASADKKGISQAAASAASGVDPMTTSQVLRGLEARELVSRTPHPEDRRAHRVTVTTNGRAVVKKAAPKVDKADNEFFNAAGGDKTRVLSALSKMAGLS